MTAATGIDRACPACGQPLYGWLELDAAGQEVLMERCENCRLGLAAGLEPSDVFGDLLSGADQLPDGRLELRLPNRDSIQARLGAASWAALDPSRRLYPTPESLRRLGANAGMRIEEIGFSRWGRCQAWMWQTMVNAFTFNQDFATHARSGSLRPTGFGARLKFGIDAVVTVLATPLILLVSVPLELVAALTGRGGVMVAVVTPSRASDNGHR